MKYILLFCLLAFHGVSYAQMPAGVGGFVLNTDIEQYKPYLKSKTTLPIRFMEAIQEVEVQKKPGFKSGYIAYGSCASPGKIVRIKLKYKDSSKTFFEELLQAYRKKFGKPKWLGDPFHVVSTWKWTFRDDENLLDMYLEHNLSNQDEKIGNSVKMTMRNMVQDELDCFEKKNPGYRKSTGNESSGAAIDFNDLIPE